MTEMLERVARRLAKVGGVDPDGERGGAPNWKRFELTARAAIEAMREPSMEILEAGHNAMFAEPWDGSTAAMMGAGFDAMIDAALTPNTPAPASEPEPRTQRT